MIIINEVTNSNSITNKPCYIDIINNNYINGGNEMVEIKENDESYTFIEEGHEYRWLEQTYSNRTSDFTVWSAEDVDTGEIVYFVVDKDDDFIDWGPCETESEAIDFLDCKDDDDYYDDDDDYDDLYDDDLDYGEDGLY